MEHATPPASRDTKPSWGSELTATQKSLIFWVVLVVMVGIIAAFAYSADRL